MSRNKMSRNKIKNITFIEYSEEDIPIRSGQVRVFNVHIQSKLLYRDVNPVPTSPLADDIATASLGR